MISVSVTDVLILIILNTPPTPYIVNLFSSVGLEKGLMS